MLRASAARRFLWGRDLGPLVEGVPRGNFIGGAFTPGTTRDVASAGGGGGGARALVASSPSDEVPLMTVAPIHDPRGAVDAAVTAAAAGQREWAAASAAARGDALTRLAAHMDARADDLARVEALCSGMCIRDARFSVGSSADTFRRFGGAVAMLPCGSVIPPFECAAPGGKNGNGIARAHTVREPVGVVGLITPFNYPLEMGAWKMAPALAAGNAVVWKPPCEAPLSAQIFAECVAAAGIPAGVVNIVHGLRETGEAIVRHPGVHMIGFTGSIPAGIAIQVAAAQSGLKRCNLELGGNAPLIVCDDFPLEAAADVAMACFGNNGQSCTSVRRVYVSRARRNAFLMAIVARIKTRRLGHALDPDVDQGPVIDGCAMERVIEAVREAELRGARLVVGGYRATFPAGYFVAPTVLTDVPTADDPIVAKELFGPVMVVRAYDDGDVESALDECERSSYGLSANVLTKDVDAAASIAARLPAGTVWVNAADVMNATTPFGGIRLSGNGSKDLGVAGLDGYSNFKTVITVHPLGLSADPARRREAMTPTPPAAASAEAAEPPRTS